MLNYIKSELYRISHSSALYLTTAVFAALPLMLNLILWGFSRTSPDFPYASTSFSFSNVVASPMIFCFCALFVVFILYEKSRKNGTLKNIAAFGISNVRIFAARTIVSMIASAVILIITEAVYIGSALLLLPNEGPVTVTDMLTSVGAVSLVAVSSILLAVLLIQLFERSTLSVCVWLCVFWFIPQVLLYLSFAAGIPDGPALWLPANFFNLTEVNLTNCILLWDTPQGLARCLIAGLAGIIIFSALGILTLKKKDI